jgi:DNA end-binding protein Ku
LWAAG